MDAVDFFRLFEHGLVFRDTALVDYCPELQVVLSNEDSQGGSAQIVTVTLSRNRRMSGHLRITEYADKLLEGLKDVDYPANIRCSRKTAIANRPVCLLIFRSKGSAESLIDTDPAADTLFWVTFRGHLSRAGASDSGFVPLSGSQNTDALDAYRVECSKKTEFERTQLVKDKTRVKIEGLTAINPV